MHIFIKKGRSGARCRLIHVVKVDGMVGLLTESHLQVNSRMLSHCGLVGNLYFCKSIFKKMGQKAISIDEQIQLLHSRGIVINNEEKAKEVLFDVGYFRLGKQWSL